VEIWRLTNDVQVDVDKVAASAPPDEEQLEMSRIIAARNGQYAPYGHFRPWAKLTHLQFTYDHRLAYPTLAMVGSGSLRRVYLYDVRTGSLVQIIDVNVKGFYQVDVNKRHLFLCERDAVHVYPRASGTEVLRIPNNVAVAYVESLNIIEGDSFVSPLTLSPGLDDSFPKFLTGRCIY
jgi:hypothetical protein